MAGESEPGPAPSLYRARQRHAKLRSNPQHFPKFSFLMKTHEATCSQMKGFTHFDVLVNSAHNSNYDINIT